MEPVETLNFFVKYAGFAVSAVTGLVGISQWRTMRNRNKLKADLEILKLCGDASTNITSITHLKHRIERRLARQYPPPGAPANDIDKSDLFFGLLFILGGLLLVPHALEGSNRVFAITGVLATLSGGLFGIYKGLERKFAAPRGTQ